MQVLTYKIQLLVDSDDATLKKQVIDTLYSWQNICFRCANMIMAHYFIQDQLKQFFYFTEKIQLKLADIKRDAEGVLTTSRMNTSYRVLSDCFKKQLPSDIYTNLNTELFTYYEQNREAYKSGEAALPSFKRNNPMPIKSRSIKNFKPIEGSGNYRFTLFKLPFRTFTGKQRHAKAFLQQVYKGELLFCDSHIQVKDGKIFLLMVTKKETPIIRCDTSVIAEAQLGIDVPVLVVIEGVARARIGNKDEFLHRRVAIQSAMKRCQSAVGFNRTGKGVKRLMKPVKNFRDIEANYTAHKAHVYSRRLIDFCVKYGAGTLILCNQSDREASAKDDVFLLRNWGFAGLKQKIAYKAKLAGIDLVVE